MNAFGKILSELRQARGMTQRELAKILYVTDGTISNYENCVHYPDVEKLMELADYFHVTTDYLLGRCKTNLSPDTLSEPLFGQQTVGAVIESLRSLDEDHKLAYGIILHDMLSGELLRHAVDLPSSKSDHP